MALATLVNRQGVLLRTDHIPNLMLAKGKRKSYVTLMDKIVQIMPFKVEFMKGTKCSWTLFPVHPLCCAMQLI